MVATRFVLTGQGTINCCPTRSGPEATVGLAAAKRCHWAPSPYWDRAMAKSVSPLRTTCVRARADAVVRCLAAGIVGGGEVGIAVNWTADGATAAEASAAEGSVTGCGAVGISPDVSYNGGSDPTVVGVAAAAAVAVRAIGRMSVTSLRTGVSADEVVVGWQPMVVPAASPPTANQAPDRCHRPLPIVRSRC
jgi:hypothetical protein